MLNGAPVMRYARGCSSRLVASAILKQSQMPSLSTSPFAPHHFSSATIANAVGCFSDRTTQSTWPTEPQCGMLTLRAFSTRSSKRARSPETAAGSKSL